MALAREGHRPSPMDRLDYLKKGELAGGEFAVEEDVIGGAFDVDAEAFELVDVVDAALAAGDQDRVDAFGTDAGDADEAFAVGGVDLDGVVGEVVFGPGKFGVYVEGEVAVWVEGHVFHGEIVIS